MSDEGIWVSADPSMMELMAEHYVELDGYNFDALHVVLEACASDTL